MALPTPARGDLADFRALASRIDINGPRYTSYPTADRFHGEFDEGGYLAALDDCRRGAVNAATPAPLSLYVHIPFCQDICYYCGCNKIATRDHRRSARYVRYLAQEMALAARHLGDTRRAVAQSHWGGGTPTFLDPDEMRDVMAALNTHFDLLPGGEHSIELDPRRVDDERMALLAELGFNRVSLGVQDFDEEVQRAIHRMQSEEETRRVVDAARRMGMRSVSMDLIYGLPHQTRERFAATVNRVLALRPDRLSVYSYAHLPHLFKPQRRIGTDTLPAAGEKLDILVSTIAQLTDAGYVYIGMDHFALPDDDLAAAQREGRLQRNFQGYSTCAGYDQIGFGVSSIGSVAGRYVQNARTMDEYYAALDAGQLPVLRGLATTAEDRLRKDAIGELMCNGVLDLTALSARHGMDARGLFAAEIADLAPLERDGLVRVQPGHIEVTALGRLLVRRVAMVFDGHLRADATHARHLAETAPPVSACVQVHAVAREVPLTRHSRYSRVI